MLHHRVDHEHHQLKNNYILFLFSLKMLLNVAVRIWNMYLFLYNSFHTNILTFALHLHYMNLLNENATKHCHVIFSNHYWRTRYAATP